MVVAQAFALSFGAGLARAEFVDWDSVTPLGSATSYTASDDGFIVYWQWTSGGSKEIKVTSADGTNSYTVDPSGGYDDNSGVATIPVNKGDTITVLASIKSNKAYFVPASGGTSVEDLKEELKKGTFEEIKKICSRNKVIGS